MKKDIACILGGRRLEKNDRTSCLNEDKAKF